MYSITTIRLQDSTKVFQNTESNGLYPYDNACDELKRLNARECDFDRLRKMKIYDRLTIEILDEKSDKIWFVYINKVS